MRTPALAAALLPVAPAVAVVLAPPPAEIRAAAAEGVTMAGPHEGYKLRDHVIYAVRDARGIDPADGAVDAVVLATPLERTRHAAFLGTYIGRPVTPEQAREKARVADGEIGFIVFAHGMSGIDEDFPARFSAATLRIGERVLPSTAREATEPSEGVYPLAASDRNRRVATVTYRFALAGVPNAATAQAHLIFTDASGKAFDLPCDLAAYR